MRDRMVTLREGSARRAVRMVEPTEPVAPAMSTLRIADMMGVASSACVFCVADLFACQKKSCLMIIMGAWVILYILVMPFTVNHRCSDAQDYKIWLTKPSS